MGLVRLASRAVIGAFERPADVAAAVSDVQRLGVRAADVSVLGKADVLTTLPVPKGRRGLFGLLAKEDNWLGEIQSLDVPSVGKLTGLGPLAEVLGRSPSTSPTGALVMQGIPQRDAVIYEDLLKQGKIVVLVGVADRQVGERVRAALERRGAEFVSYHAGRPYGTAFHGVGPGLR